MSRPILVYDDDCGFCTWCAQFAEARGDFELIGFAQLSPDQRARLPSNFESCAHLIADGSVYSCGAAIEEAMARMGLGSRAVVAAFRLLPYRARIREPLYRWGADRRDWWGRLLSR